MQRLKTIAFVAVFIITAFVLGGCAGKETEYTRRVFALDTWITFKVYGDSRAEKALDSAIERIRQIEARMSPAAETSDISRINAGAGKRPVKVHDDTFYVIQKALEYSRMTGGAFDITVYPLSDLWGITTGNQDVPSDEEIKQRLELVDYRKVVLDPKSRTVYLAKAGMGIDLGGIAKGYAADEVAGILAKNGVKHALINMGGNIVVIGTRVDGQMWRIGIRDPRGEADEYFAVIKARDCAVVSSGDYERYMVDVFKETGIRYHHIFDPSTGYPARSGLIATTVVSERSIDADVLSTCIFVMGAKKGLELVNGIEGVEALAVTEDRRVYLSNGLKDRINITDGEYKVAQ